MDFKDFCKTEESIRDKDKDQANKAKIKRDQASVEEKISKYSTMSKSEMLNEFIKESAVAKKNGLFDDDKINIMKETLFPYLTDEQKSQFDNLIGLVN